MIGIFANAVTAGLVTLPIGGAPIARFVVIFAAFIIAEGIIGIVAADRIEFAAFILFFLVCDEVIQGEAVMSCNEVDGVMGTSAVISEHGACTSQQVAHIEIWRPIRRYGVFA